MPRAGVAYLLDWRDSDAPRALQALQARGVRAEVATRPFTAPTASGEVALGRGTISLPVSIQTLVHVYHFAPSMSTDCNSTPQVGDHQIQVFVFSVEQFGI